LGKPGNKDWKTMENRKNWETNGKSGMPGIKKLEIRENPELKMGN
jgi:hypothetical protein